VLSFTYNEERIRRLQERALRDYPEAVILKEQGDSYTGVFKRLDKGNTRHGPRYIAVFEDVKDSSEKAVWLTHKALASQFSAKKVKSGELTTIVRGVEKESSKGYDYIDWRVEVDREEEETEPDWDAVADSIADEDDVSGQSF
jgi:hypothetical protein